MNAQLKESPISATASLSRKQQHRLATLSALAEDFRDVKFLHFRAFELQHNSKLNTYLERPTTSGGVTVAFRELPATADGQVTEKEITYALAMCHPKDAYKKSDGRLKAAQRLKSSHYTQVFRGTLTEFIRNMETFIGTITERITLRSQEIRNGKVVEIKTPFERPCNYRRKYNKQKPKIAKDLH